MGTSPGDRNDELARNWLDHGVYGLFKSGVLTPVG